jgi:hypothetical protein
MSGQQVAPDAKARIPAVNVARLRNTATPQAAALAVARRAATKTK